jgi:fumarate hydratase class II
MSATAIEEDALGEVRVPADHLWGAQTERSRENFSTGVDPFRVTRPVVRALGVLKQAEARANRQLGQLPADKAALIEAAAQEVIDRELGAEFPLVVFQTGSRTQTSMSANGVMANPAILLAGGFDEHCARGIEPDRARIAANLNNSPMLVTALSLHIRYDKAARNVLTARRVEVTLREAALKPVYVTVEQFGAWVRPVDMRHKLAE